MKTEKLYYIDAYLKEFDAIVLSSTECERGYDIVLDKTVFFPEEGGQYSDKGYINDSFVFDVQEKDGIIHHYSQKPIKVNESVHCSINFDERFDKMQQHTAEHMISGFLHKLYGIENTGFHLGAVDVTLDTSRPITKKEMKNVEELVNSALVKNLKTQTYFPDENQLSELEYRSKLDLRENVRIVKIGDVDTCACCAPHVAYTGEIGLVKLVDAVKHKGGSRIRMLAGKRAYDYVAKIVSEALSVSVLTSSPPDEISSEVSRILDSRAKLEAELKAMQRSTAELMASNVKSCKGNLVKYLPGFDTDALRAFVNLAKENVSEAVVALSGEPGNLRYVIGYSSDGFSEFLKSANTALSGKGGGRPPMATGSFSADVADVEKYFKS